jgi:hypothetical protein
MLCGSVQAVSVNCGDRVHGGREQAAASGMPRPHEVGWHSHPQPALEGLWVVLGGVHSLVLSVEKSDSLVAHVKQRGPAPTIAVTVGAAAVLHENQQYIGGGV